MVTVVFVIPLPFPLPTTSCCSETASMDRRAGDDGHSDSVIAGCPTGTLAASSRCPGEQYVSLHPLEHWIRKRNALLWRLFPNGWPSNPSVSRCFQGELWLGPLAFCPGQLVPSVPWLLGLGLSRRGQGRSAPRAAEDTVLFKCLYDIRYSLPKHLFWESTKWLRWSADLEWDFSKLPALG